MELEIFDCFNEAYRESNNNSPCMVYMAKFIDKLGSMIGSKNGLLYRFIDGKLQLVSHSKYFREDIFDMYKNFEIDISDSICLDAINRTEITVGNDTIDNIFGKYILEDGGAHYPGLIKSVSFDSKCDDIPNSHYYVVIPFEFNKTVMGALIYFGDKEFDKSLPKQLDCVKTLLGVLAMNKQRKFEIPKTSLFVYQVMDGILDTIHDGVILLDSNFKVLYSNAYFLKLYNNRSVVGSNIMEIIPEVEALFDTEHSIEKVFKNRKITVKHNDGEVRIMINSVLSGGEFYHLINTFQNIEKETQEDSSKKLIGYLSHELRTPLQTIIMGNAILKYESRNLKINAFDDGLNKIAKACKDITKIVDDILDFSKLSASAFDIQIGNVNISDLLKNVASEHEPLANEKKIKLITLLDKTLPKNFRSDETRVNQILSNLLSNAIKYSNSGDIKINVEKKEEQIVFSIIDQGVGIKRTELNQLFKDYGKTSSSFSSKIKSTGLGLAISHKLANLLGGKIKVKSEYGKGSVFSFYHPLNICTNTSISSSEISSEELSGNILLVDDDEDSLHLLKLLIEHINYDINSNLEVEILTDGEKVYDLCNINQYDIIFMDVNLKNLNGCTISKILRTRGYSGKIIIMTGDITVKKNGGNIYDDIIYKPFSDEIVVKLLKKYMHK